MIIRRHRHRRLLALFALLGLLFQQLAMATYVCPIERDMSSAGASTLPPCHQSGTADRARCHSHCHPQIATSDHPPQPSVPAAMLPPTTWLRAAPWMPELATADLPCELIARANAPPITIQHCTFQI